MGVFLQRAFAAGVVAVIAALPFSGCAIVGPSLERSMARDQIRKDGSPATLGNAVTPMGRVLLAFSEIGQAAGLDPATIWVKASGEAHINAGSVGARHFVVTATTAELSYNACFLWGLVAHELAHDVLNHGAYKVAAATALGVVATGVGLVIPGGGYLVQGAGWLGMSAYSRSHEHEADAKAIELLTRAGKPPWALRYTLELMRDVHGDRTAALAWLSTHPLNADRLAKQPSYTDADAERDCAGHALRPQQVEHARQAIAAGQRRAREDAEAATEAMRQQRERGDVNPSAPGVR